MRTSPLFALALTLLATSARAQTPHIDSLIIDETPSRLTIHGSFSMTATPEASINGNLLQLIQWDSAFLVCDLPAAGADATGIVRVSQGAASNTHRVRAWQLVQYYQFHHWYMGGGGEDKDTWDTLIIRGDPSVFLTRKGLRVIALAKGSRGHSKASGYNGNANHYVYTGPHYDTNRVVEGNVEVSFRSMSDSHHVLDSTLNVVEHSSGSLCNFNTGAVDCTTWTGRALQVDEPALISRASDKAILITLLNSSELRIRHPAYARIQIDVSDLLGRIIFTSSLPGETSEDIVSLRSITQHGPCLVRVSTAGQTITRKFIF